MTVPNFQSGWVLSRRRTASSKAGFTLAELLVVIVIIVIMSVLTIAALPDGSGAATTSSATRASGMFSLARSLAVSKNTYVRILVNVSPQDVAVEEAAARPVQSFRRVVMLYWDTDQNAWEFYQDLYLSGGVFFDPSESTPVQPLSGPQSTANPWSKQVALYDGTSTTTMAYNWQVYEWAPNGNCSSSGVFPFVVQANFLDVNGPSTTPPDPELIDGFALLTTGRVLHYEDANHITGGTP